MLVPASRSRAFDVAAAKAPGRKVTATLVVVRMKDGSTQYVSQDSELPEGVSQESVDLLTDLGFLSSEAESKK